MNDQTIILANDILRAKALQVIRNLPVDGTLELVIRLRKKARTSAQNRLFWGARLKEISEQAWLGGRQYSADTWHEYLKREYLPEGNEEDFGRMVKASYQKWDELPGGERVLVGSTTQLTTFGMTIYMTQVESFAAQELGVRFSADMRYAA